MVAGRVNKDKRMTYPADVRSLKWFIVIGRYQRTQMLDFVISQEMHGARKLLRTSSSSILYKRSFSGVPRRYLVGH